MSLEINGVWAAGVWSPTVWAAGVWREGVFAIEQVKFSLAINRANNFDLAIGRNISHTLPIAREKEL